VNSEILEPIWGRGGQGKKKKWEGINNITIFEHETGNVINDDCWAQRPPIDQFDEKNRERGGVRGEGEQDRFNSKIWKN